MKIVDADCHISPTLESGNSIPIDELLRRMDKAQVDQALTWLQPPYRREIDAANAYVYRATQDFPGRIIGYGWVDPRLGVDQAQDMAKRCIEEYGFAGVKLNGAQNEFRIDDPQLSLPIIEQLAKMKTTVAFHVGTDAFENTHPFRLAKIARQFSDLPIFCIHMGGVGLPDLTDACIEMAQACPNVTLIGSMVHHVPILKAIRTLGPERLCYGSDTPFALMHVCVAMYHALLSDELSPPDYAKVMGENVLRVLAHG